MGTPPEKQDTLDKFLASLLCNKINKLDAFKCTCTSVVFPLCSALCWCVCTACIFRLKSIGDEKKMSRQVYSMKLCETKFSSHQSCQVCTFRITEINRGSIWKLSLELIPVCLILTTQQTSEVYQSEPGSSIGTVLGQQFRVQLPGFSSPQTLKPLAGTATSLPLICSLLGRWGQEEMEQVFQLRCTV